MSESGQSEQRPVAAPAKLRVRISSHGAPTGLDWLTPGRNLCWGNCEFTVNSPTEEATDFWIVLANARPTEQCRVAPQNTLFIAGEPPAKKIYPQKFYRQFGHVVDSHAAARHPDLHIDALGLPWSIGLNWREGGYVYGYDRLKGLTPPKKENRIATVCSNTAKTAGQRQRLAFLKALKAQLGDDLVHFGKGFEPIDDKMDGVLPYRFHLVLENSQSPHYWTEKLTDAYLGWAFPLYVGCPNLSDYFAPESFVALDMRDVPTAVRTIRTMLAQPESSDPITVLRTAREQVLDVYNPFARFAHWANLLYSPGPPQSVTLQSEKAFRFVRGWFYRLRHR